MNEGFVQNTIQKVTPSANSVAYDIGANVGTYSKELAQKFSVVYAFEPEPKNIENLRKELTPHLNAFIIEKAISDHTGTTKFWPSTNPGGHTINPNVGEKGTWGHTKDRFGEVECVSIDDFSLSHSPPDFIKMDIEGAEDFVWKGATRTLEIDKPDIILEVHQTVQLMDLYQFFKDRGYLWFTDQGQETTSLRHDQHYFLTTKGHLP